MEQNLTQIILMAQAWAFPPACLPLKPWKKIGCHLGSVRLRTIICCLCDRGGGLVLTAYLLLDHLSARHRQAFKFFCFCRMKKKKQVSSHVALWCFSCQRFWLVSNICSLAKIRNKLSDLLVWRSPLRFGGIETQSHKNVLQVYLPWISKNSLSGCP